MSELRKDPIVDRWVIFAPERGLRPMDTESHRSERSASGEDPRVHCPFCYGNESHTPPEILADRERGSAPNAPGWRLRVIPNKFPALRVEGTLDRRGEGPYDRMNGIGAHEVIVESPDHDRDLSELSIAQIERIVLACRERMLDLERDVRLRYVLVFKNHGARAGASLEHGHCQLIATPIVPQVVAQELAASREHFRQKERCVYCDVIAHESREGSRVVLERDAFLSIEPFASRYAFETWILPRRHVAAFTELAPGEVAPLASILQESLARIRRALDRPHYNIVLHTAPCREPRLEHYHWHLEITPRRVPLAGFEWGSGFHINTTTPEEAASYLRGLRL